MIDKKIVVTQAMIPEAHDMLTETFTNVVLPDEPGQEAFERAAIDADAIVLRTNVTITRAFVEKATNLKIISRTGAGADNVDHAACAEKGILVCNLPGINNISVAEHAVTMMACIAKFLPLMDKSVREPDGWGVRRKNLPRELHGKTVGVVGLGAIGALTAGICKEGFKTEILAYDPYVDAARFPDYKLTDDLKYLFANSDFVTLHLPSLPATKKIVNKDLLGAMQPHAVLVNCARGDIVDSDDLYDALKEGKLAAAGLDVFDPEPPAHDDKLLSLPNVLVSPHTAALTKEASTRMSTEACRQVIVYFETGKPLWVYQPPK